MIYDKVKARGIVRRVVTDQNGMILDDLQVNNLVVSSGQAFICSRMAGVSNGVMTHMGLGSGTTAANAADTDIESILGTRGALDSTTVSANVITFSATFSAGSATGAVTEAGVFDASTSGTMLCRTVFPVYNKQANDTMSFTWSITLTAS